MTGLSNDFLSKAQVLRDDFIAKLPSRFQSIATLWHDWTNASADMALLNALHREVHSLAGAGATFGFIRVSDSARVLDKFLRKLLEQNGVTGGVDAAQFQTLFHDLTQSVDEQQAHQHWLHSHNQLQAALRKRVSAQDDESTHVDVIDGCECTASDIMKPESRHGRTIVRIGTPLSPTATRVMLLGSGELGKEVIISLQRYGVEVIAVDRYANAPGHQVAHRAHVISMTDGAALRALIEKEKPHIILPEIEAIATDVLVQIEREGIAQVFPSARAAQLTMNREGIRRLAAEELGLPTSRYAFADSLAALQQAIDAGIGYPCFVKPVMSSSGKGQSMLKSAADVAKAWDYAMSGGRVSEARVIVESKIEFDFEITLLTVRANTADGAIGTVFCEPIGHVQVNGDYVESWQPQPMSRAALAKAKDIAKRATDALGGRGIFGVEMFVKGDEVWFSEVSPRPHDTGMVTMISQFQNEFELHARAVLGLPVSTDLMSPGASAVIYGGMEKAGIVFENVEKALNIANTELRLFGKPEAFAKRRMGVALARAENVDTARENAKRCAALVKPSAQ